VLLRFAPGSAWPLLLGAVRDEFADRAWDPPGRHWDGALVGGRDRVAGGTWLAVDPTAPAVAALLNGRRLPVPPDGRRPSRGGLPLSALTRPPADPGPPLPEGAELARYDGFHLLRATVDRVDVWSWDGLTPTHHRLDPGDHVIVNGGVDVDTPLVDRLLTALAGLPTTDPRPGRPTAEAWHGWVDLMAGNGIDPTDPRALIVRRIFQNRVYGSTSASLVALSARAARYEFTAPPGAEAPWYEVPV
jgi:uncharacterized protein with NRDE domain